MYECSSKVQHTVVFYIVTDKIWVNSLSVQSQFASPGPVRVQHHLSVLMCVLLDTWCSLNLINTVIVTKVTDDILPDGGKMGNLLVNKDQLLH